MRKEETENEIFAVRSTFDTSLSELVFKRTIGLCRTFRKAIGPADNGACGSLITLTKESMQPQSYSQLAYARQGRSILL